MSASQGTEDAGVMVARRGHRNNRMARRGHSLQSPSVGDVRGLGLLAEIKLRPGQRVYTWDSRRVTGRRLMVTRLQKWGNSQGVRFPKTVLDEARLKVGDDVSLLVRGGKIIVEPARKVRGRFRLKALVSRMPHDYRPEELDWGGPVGRETW